MTISEFFSLGFVMKYVNDHAGEIPSKTVAILWATACVVIALAAYFLGSLNFAIIISGKTYGDDIRKYGSKNAGMTNMMRTYGKKAAGLTLLGDALKAVVACLIGYALLGQLGAYIAGVFCVIGHMFPVYYKFRGGKGVVTTAIAVLMCNPYVFLILFALFVALVLMTKYISLGSIMCMLIYPLILFRIETWLTGRCPYVPFALLLTVLVVFKHRTNITRLLNGTESKFSFKKSVKAKKDEGESEKE